MRFITTGILFSTLLLLAAVSVGFSQSAGPNRLEGETAEGFARRVGRAGAEIVHPVVEMEAWGNKRSIFAFYSGATAGEVDGYLFVPVAPSSYRKILINKFEEEGDTPKIESFFFANADKDKAKELVVICSWGVHHYDVSGTLYGTYIFDDIGSGPDSGRFRRLDKLSEKVSGGCDCTYRDAKTKGTKKFETAAQVKAGLRRLGF